MGFVPAMVNKAFLHLKLANQAESEYEKSDQFFEAAHWARLALSKNPDLRDA